MLDINNYHKARRYKGSLEKAGKFIKTKKGWGIEFCHMHVNVTIVMS